MNDATLRRLNLIRALCLRRAGEGRWGSWFPAIVVVTLGPPGSLIGDLKIRKELR